MNRILSKRVSGSLLLGLVLILAVLAVVHDVVSQASWLRGFMRSFRVWRQEPTTSLRDWRPHAPAPGEIVAVVLQFVAGIWASVLLLAPTRYRGNRIMLAGFTLIMSVAAAGVLGTCMVTFGVIDRPALLGLALGLFALLSILTACTGRSDLFRPYLLPRARISRAGPWSKRLGRWYAGGTLFVLAVLVSLRDLISPVVDWDATAYHAELARLWFLQRPSPPLTFGPSLGVELSANYPPLFPASGLVSDVASGRLTDVLLRLASPLVMVGAGLVLYVFVRSHFGRVAAWWSALLFGTAPLVVLYGSWTTYYALATALGLLAVVLATESLEQSPRHIARWLVTGVVLGLALLTSFYGWFAVAGVVVVLIARRVPWRTRLRDVVVLAVPAFLVAGPWLIRNWVELGDPVYPITLPLFHARGLSGPLWRAAQSELRTNADNYWRGSWLRLHQAFTLILDRHLVILGATPLLLLAARPLRHKPASRIVAVSALIILGAELLPGWFFLRSLLPATPFLAVGGGVALSRLAAWARWRRAMGRRKVESVHALSMAVLLFALFVGLFSLAVSLSLAVAGPGQAQWTTEMPSSSNFMALDQSLGSVSGTLRTTFGKDVLAWHWLNNHLGSGRLATFEIRTYYLDHPGRIFYLDGREAEPLLHINTARGALKFLRARDIRYVFVPAWSDSATAIHDPAFYLLPLDRFLGGQDFPLAARFGKSHVYRVGLVH